VHPGAGIGYDLSGPEEPEVPEPEGAESCGVLHKLYFNSSAFFYMFIRNRPDDCFSLDYRADASGGGVHPVFILRHAQDEQSMRMVS
jgi:hypothetical protein